MNGAAIARRRVAGQVIGSLQLFMMAVAVIATGESATISAYAQQPTADAALFTRLDANNDGRLTAQEVTADDRRLFERLLRKADANRDQALSRDEFLAGLTNSQPEKPIEEKQPAELPGADAIRWLLLSMDTDRDGSITEAEVPANFKPAFQTLVAQIDRNEDGQIARQELSQGSRQLSNIATRIAAQMQVNVTDELAKLRASQGAAFDRFEGQRGRGPEPAMEMMNTPRETRQQFLAWDANSDGVVTATEVPAADRAAFRQLMQTADLDRNGQLTEREVLAAARRGGPRDGRRGNPARGRRAGARSVIEGVQQRPAATPGMPESESAMEGPGMSANSSDAMSGKER
jgi:Ca2+-binding EF-hand superfamily protein